jgi:hypothetical protein
MEGIGNGDDRRILITERGEDPFIATTNGAPTAAGAVRPF